MPERPVPGSSRPVGDRTGSCQVLPVRERVALGRRTAIAPRSGHDLDTAPRRLDGLAGRGGDGVDLDREPLRELAATEDLHQAPLGDQAPCPQRRRVDLGAGVQRLERVQVHHVVLDAERVVEALGLGCAAVDRRLTTLEPGPDPATGAGVLTLGPAAGGLATLAADAAREPLGRLARAGSRLQIMDLHQTSSTVTRWGTLASMPRITALSSCSRVVLMPWSPSARSVPRCLGFTPIDDRTWVTFSAIMRPR